MRRFHEHLAQRALVVANVAKPDGSDDLTTGKRHPKAARSRLIEVGDIEKVRLVLRADVETNSMRWIVRMSSTT
jgi:hypothetical protein